MDRVYPRLCRRTWRGPGLRRDGAQGSQFVAGALRAEGFRTFAAGALRAHPDAPASFPSFVDPQCEWCWTVLRVWFTCPFSCSCASAGACRVGGGSYCAAAEHPHSVSLRSVHLGLFLCVSHAGVLLPSTPWAAGLVAGEDAKHVVVACSLALWVAYWGRSAHVTVLPLFWRQ